MFLVFKNSAKTGNLLAASICSAVIIAGVFSAGVFLGLPLGLPTGFSAVVFLGLHLGLPAGFLAPVFLAGVFLASLTAFLASS